MTFKHWNSYHKFCNYVQTKSRYLLDEMSMEFLDSIIATCAERETVIEEDSIVWRAQNGHDWKPYYQVDPDTLEDVYIDDMVCPFPFERMKPLRNSASEGRANPKGIPCLYVATDKETAMSEVRPWLGSIISIGKFKVKRKLKILDFSIAIGKRKFHLPFNELSETETIETVWANIDSAFSIPVKLSDLNSAYAPTQIISEFIKSKGYDGIAYKSSLAEGHNIALFDLDSADVIDCFTYEPVSVKYHFKEVVEP